MLDITSTKNGNIQHSFRFLTHGFRPHSSNIPVQNQIRIAQRIVVDEVVQFRPLRHGHVQRIRDSGAVNGDHPPIQEQQFHAPGVHVEMASSCIVLHVCVLSALRYSYSGLSCFLMIRSRTFFDGSKGFVLFSKEYKKSEPFSYREKVRILLLWCRWWGSNPHVLLAQGILSFYPHLSSGVIQ